MCACVCVCACVCMCVCVCVCVCLCMQVLVYSECRAAVAACHTLPYFNDTERDFSNWLTM